MNPPANWYEDPTGRHGQRYWDGEQWTEHVFTDGVQGVDPLDAGTEDGADQPDGGVDAEDAGGTEAQAAAAEQDAAVTPAVSEESDAGGDQAQMLDEEAAQPADEDVAHEDQQVAAEHLESVEGADTTDTADTATDTTAAAPLPQRGAHIRSSTEPSADAPVDGLFETPTEDASPAAEPAGAMWTPDDAAHEAVSGGESEDAAVAREVETEDVVASLDEVSDAGEQEQDATDAPQDDEDTGFRPSPVGDLSDAFVLAPETASRLVGRRHAEMAEQAEQVDEADQGSQEAQEEAPATEEQPAAHEREVAPTGAIDAPPPAMPPTSHTPATGGGLGITGDLVSGAFAERADGGPVALQNSRLLRCAVGADASIVARQGTMVAYQGDVSFERQGAGGVTRALKRAATGEGLAMMRVEGTGDVFFADGAQHVFVLQLDGGPGLSVNGRNVLAFSAALQWDIERVKGATLLAGGLFNTTLTGTGWVALVSDGEPVVLRTDEAPTLVDVNALVAWSAGLSTRIVNSASAKSLVGLGSGEAFQMGFDGAGVVIVQPSEGATGAASAG